MATAPSELRAKRAAISWWASRTGKRTRAGKWIATNSAVLLNPSGQRIFTYDKIHLVPFGEYVPLRKWLTFAGKLTADIGDFTPGYASYRVGRLPGGTFGAFICYEAIFPNEVRRFTANGAELLINMSNDGWFGRSSAPAQHLMMARVRAVENRRWLLRCTNNGFTVAVDPYGRIVARLSNGYSWRARCSLRFSQRADALRAIRRLVRMALFNCLGSAARNRRLFGGTEGGGH